jgi:hypothetical protein
MLQKISLTIIFFSLLAYPSFGGGLSWESKHQTNNHRQGMFLKNRYDSSTNTFKKKGFNFRKKSVERNRTPRLIGFPAYNFYGGERYEKEKETVTVIVEGNKMDENETTTTAAKAKKSFTPPRIVTLEDTLSHRELKSGGDSYRVVEIRGNEVTVAEISPR